MGRSSQRIRLSDNDDERLVYLLILQERMNDDLEEDTRDYPEF